MKQTIHPDYHPVVFRDRAANFAFLTRSTATSERTISWEDGSTYPVVDVDGQARAACAATLLRWLNAVVTKQQMRDARIGRASCRERVCHNV